ncbi:phosphotransferase [Clostridium sp. YIM B02555]|uniref:aminoglycoside phosphotransferase family protein n=1 Tax=Clostridium sp. YIM B02555 TaxID=2911968 RepID=UPI001EEF5A4D|nr:phosphotransferase [Clostridium sp. YIM B02555]
MPINDFKTRILIEKGWSDDKKYCVITPEGKKYLLRISKIEQKERKKVEFEMMQYVEELGVPMCKPIEFGTCDEGVFFLQSWIEGEDFVEILTTLTNEEQYLYGIEAGKILKHIHTIPAPGTQEEWEVRFNRKIMRKIQMYKDCPIKYENGQSFIDYINENRYLLKNRSQCYQHGDYHVGNMMIDYEGKLQIIDFDRYDFGDPWEEFNRIVWCAQQSPLFASGMVNGYFDGNVPMDFWQLLALYISSNTLSALPWAIQFEQSEIDTMINQAKDILEWYKNMKDSVPSWYKSM